MVKDLRETTGAGMMDCKAALEATERRHGSRGRLAAQEGPRQGREEGRPRRRRRPRSALSCPAPRASSSRSIPKPTSSRATISSRVSCKMIAQVALDAGDDVEAIKAAKVGGDHGRRCDLRRDRQDRREHDAASRQAAERSRRARSAAMCIAPSPTVSARSACWSRSKSPGKADELAALGRQVAMHVASANPLAIDAAGVDPAVVKREKDILADKFRQQGKPENMIEKIVESGLKTFYKEQTPARAAVHLRRQEERRPGAQGSRGQGRRADQGRRVRALCARRGHREGGGITPTAARKIVAPRRQSAASCFCGPLAIWAPVCCAGAPTRL